MTLADIDTPFARKRVIEYSKRDSNKVVRHWVDVQHVIGFLWKTRNSPNGYGEQEFSLYLFFDEKLDGMRVAYRMTHPEYYTPEQFADTVKRYGIDTYEHLIETYDGYMKGDNHIDLATIEYVRQFDQEKASCYLEYRLARLKRKELQRQEKRKAEQEKEERKKRAEEERLAAERAKYLGWADAMSPMQFGRICKTLEKQVRSNGRVMAKRDFLVKSIQNGLVPRKKENVVTWWRGMESKPKTEYRLYETNGRSYYNISKTEFDFAIYLQGRIDKNEKDSV